MTVRLLVLTPFLFMLTSCQQEQLSLPVTHAASTQEARSEIERPPAEPVDQPSSYKELLRLHSSAAQRPARDGSAGAA